MQVRASFWGAVLIVLLHLHFSHCAPVRIGTLKAVGEPFKFKATTLEGQVKEAIELSKDSEEPMDLLMGMHKNDPDAVLRLLKPYLKDASEDVIYAISQAVSCAPRAEEAMELIRIIVPNRSIGHLSVNVLYDNFSCEELRTTGGEKLKHALFLAALRSRYTDRGYMLLTCFKDDPALLPFLLRRRKSYPEKPQPSRPPYDADQETKTGKPKQNDSHFAEIILLDLALTEWGQADAEARISRLFSERQPEVMMVLIRHLKFVTNKNVQRQALELLRVSSILRERRSPSGKIEATSRMCDEAMIELHKVAGLALDKRRGYDFFAPRFTDEELARGYEKLKQAFAL